MHYTRRLLDRRRSGALAVLACLSALMVGVSCSSTNEDPGDPNSPDAGPEGSVALDGSASDATRDADAALFDGGPRSVVCASASCATVLVTTRGRGESDYAEGFCALLQDRTVVCWGAGEAGQLGRGEDARISDDATPARVAGLEKIVSLDHTCAVDEAGAVRCWGTGPFLRSATEATTTERKPVKLPIPSATRVATGHAAGCAITSGDVLCWGSNRYAQLAPFESEPEEAVLSPRKIQLPAGAPVDHLVLGNAAFVVRQDGSVVTWGANPPIGRVSSLFPDPYPTQSSLAAVMGIDMAEDNACAASRGTGYCWGTESPESSESEHQEPRTGRALPAPVVTPEPVVQIATTRTIFEADASRPLVVQRWCAVGDSGDVYCWGNNTGGQAGDGTRQYASQAVRVVGLPGPAAQVKTTAGATCALLVSGKIYCWGTNYYGQLGNRTIKVASLSPQEVVLP